eukprot:14148-Heterococcus_DN1.PRE.4
MHRRDHRAQYIRAGEGVVAATQLANRDEIALGMDSDKFNIHRKNNSHLAFGYGMHEDVAEWLTRAELQCVLSAECRCVAARQCLETTIYDFCYVSLTLPIILAPLRHRHAS